MEPSLLNNITAALITHTFLPDTRARLPDTAVGEKTESPPAGPSSAGPYYYSLQTATLRVAWELSEAQRQEAIHVVTLVRYAFLALSLPVTTCNVFVFLQKSMRSATSVYILGLSFAQIFFLVAHVVLSLWTGVSAQPRSSSAFCFFRLYAIDFGSVIARRGSYVVLCFVSVERLYAVLRPLHVKSFLLSRCSVLVMAGTFVVTTVWHLYVPAKLVVVMSPEEGAVAEVVEATGATTPYAPRPPPLCQTRVTDLYLRHKAVNDSFSLAIKVLMTYMSLILQIALSVVTVTALRRHNLKAAKHVHHHHHHQQQQQQPSSSVGSAKEEVRRQRERQLTVTILCTTVAYVVLSLPACLNGLLNIVLPEYHEGGSYQNLAHVVYHVCLDLQVLSCSVDFFCFLALSSNYRRTFFASFPCLKPLASFRKGDAITADSRHTLQSASSSFTTSW